MRRCVSLAHECRAVVAVERVCVAACGCSRLDVARCVHCKNVVVPNVCACCDLQHLRVRRCADRCCNRLDRCSSEPEISALAKRVFGVPAPVVAPQLDPMVPAVDQRNQSLGAQNKARVVGQLDLSCARAVTDRDPFRRYRCCACGVCVAKDNDATLVDAGCRDRDKHVR